MKACKISNGMKPRLKKKKEVIELRNSLMPNKRSEMKGNESKKLKKRPRGEKSTFSAKKKEKSATQKRRRFRRKDA